MGRQVAFVTYKEHPEITDDDSLAANALEQLGIEAVGIAWDEAGVDWTRFDAVVLRSCWDYFHHPRRFFSWIDSLKDQGVNLLNDHATVRWNAEKTYLADLRTAGVTIVPTVYAEQYSNASIREILNEQGWERAAVKPTISGTSLHTWVSGPIDAVSSLRDDQKKLDSLLRERSMMLQEYLPEIETTGELSLIYFGGEYSHAVRKVPRMGDFRVQDDFGGTWNAVEPNEIIKAQADAVLRASGRASVGTSARTSVYARVDGVQRGETFLLMELEMIEPHLFLAAHPAAAERFAQAVTSRVSNHAAASRP